MKKSFIIPLLVFVLSLCFAFPGFCKGELGDNDAFTTYIGRTRSEVRRIAPVFEELEESGKRLEKAKSLMKESHACKKEVEVRIADIEAAERDLGEKRGKKYEAERLLIMSEHERNVAQLSEDHTFRTESMRKECAKKIVALSTELDQSTKRE